jgi:transmembrane sensor
VKLPGWSGAIAAAAAVALVAGLAWTQLRRTDTWPRVAAESTYQVIESAARRLVFEDGSVAAVRGDSDVRAQFTAAERRVLLVRGEAHFTVTPDTARPFIVSAGGAAVRAVGTAFNVRLEAERVEVLVTQGMVQVAETRSPAPATPSPLPLVAAGQRAVIARDDSSGTGAGIDVEPRSQVEIEHTLAWQSTRLVFDRTPLQDAVDAFNRHSSGKRIVIGDAVLRARLMGGTFRATNVEAFVRLLEQSAEIRSELRGDQIVLMPAR